MPKSTGRAVYGWAESENPWRYGGMTRVLDIDDLVSLAVTDPITIDHQRDNTFSLSLVAADYELLPRNAAADGEPYHQIELTSWGSNPSFAPQARVRISGIWGWPAVPAGVKSDVIELCAIWRKESPRATGRINELDQVVTESPMAMSLVKRFRYAYSKVPSF